MVNERNLFSTQKVCLPKSYFVVFYNGTEAQPERKLFLLSDLYEPKEYREMLRMTGEQPDLKLKTLVININRGYNEELKKSCRDLYGYMTYVDKVRELAKDHPLDRAVEMAIEHCIQHDILVEFLSTHRAEVMSMSIFEYNQEKHFRQIAEENMAAGWEKGRQVGRAEGKAEGQEAATLANLKSLMETLGLTAEQALGALKIPEEERANYIELMKR